MSALKYIPVITISILLSISLAHANANKQEKLLTKLQRDSQDIHSISCDFIQKSYISLFEDTIKSNGKFTFSRPDNLRWEYSSPFVSGFLLKGNQGLKWDEATSKTAPFTTENSPEMAIISEQILAWTTMNISWLRTNYLIKISSYSPAIMELTPKSNAAKSFLQLIKIFFTADASHLRGIEIHQPDGDYTKIEFSKVKLNKKLPENIFEKR